MYIIKVDRGFLGDYRFELKPAINYTDQGYKLTKNDLYKLRLKENQTQRKMGVIFLSYVINWAEKRNIE